MTDHTLYLHCKPGDVAPFVLLTGDPARVELTAEQLEDARHVCRNREFVTVTGTYRGIPVSATSGGIGAPSSAIAMHELARTGARTIVRVGTNMGVDAPLKSVVLSTGAARFEGTTPRYLPLNYPAVPDWALVQALADAARLHSFDVRLGPTASFDAYYPDMAPSLIGQGPLDLAESRRAGLVSLDMETSLVLLLGRVLGLKAASMCLVTVQAEPHIRLDAAVRIDLEHHLIAAALDGLVSFGELE